MNKRRKKIKKKKGNKRKGSEYIQHLRIAEVGLPLACEEMWPNRAKEDSSLFQTQDCNKVTFILGREVTRCFLLETVLL